MGIIFLTKPCHADRKNKGILTGKNVHPLFPLCEHRHRDTGRTEHARFIIHKKRVKQT